MAGKQSHQSSFTVLLLVLLGHTGLGLQPERAETAGATFPSNEEVATSIAINQIALLDVMREFSRATSGMAERETRCDEEAAERDTRLQEMEKVVQALQQDLRSMVQNATQETLTGLAAQQEAFRQEVLSEVRSLRQEMASEVTSLTSKVTSLTSKVTSLEQQLASEVTTLPSEVTTLPSTVTTPREELSQQACPDGWLRHESSCYLVDNTERSWEESLAFCKGLGGDLAKITSAEEHEFIKEEAPGPDWIWIGLNDKEAEGHFVWTDGSAATYTAWAEGQPGSMLDWDCIFMWPNYDYNWGDYLCSDTNRVVCERQGHA